MAFERKTNERRRKKNWSKYDGKAVKSFMPTATFDKKKINTSTIEGEDDGRKTAPTNK